jgi:CheY-like chemotaxis protein
MEMNVAVSPLRRPGALHLPPQSLLVEDNPAELYLLRKAFTTGPLPVHLHDVTGVDEALAFLHHDEPYGQAPRPSLIVTSLKLPDRSGLDLIAELKDDVGLRTIPVIVFTSYDVPETTNKSYELGAYCSMVKPVGLDPFFEAIQAMEKYWLTVVTLFHP